MSVKQAPERIVVKLCSECWEQVPSPGVCHVHDGKPVALREEEVVPLVRHEVELEEATWRAIKIYNRSLAEAHDAFPDYIDSGVPDVQTFIGGRDSRAHIIANFAVDLGIGFEQVSCRRIYMRIDEDAVFERSAEAAARPDDFGEEPIAYTWEDEGWAYEDCERDDEHAIAMYRCEVKESS